MQFEPKTYGTPRTRRPAIGHNAFLALSGFGAFVGILAGNVPGYYILGGSILTAGLALLTHPWLWRS